MTNHLRCHQRCSDSVASCPYRCCKITCLEMSQHTCTLHRSSAWIQAPLSRSPTLQCFKDNFVNAYPGDLVQSILTSLHIFSPSRKTDSVHGGTCGRFWRRGENYNGIMQKCGLARAMLKQGASAEPESGVVLAAPSCVREQQLRCACAERRAAPRCGRLRSPKAVPGSLCQRSSY